MLHESRDTSTPSPPQPPTRGRPRRTSSASGEELAELVGAAPTAGEDVEITVRDVPGEALVVQVSGDVDLATAPAVRTELNGACARADGQRVLLDLTHVAFLGSAGLHLLIETHNLCRASGVEFGVLNPQRAALRSIRMSGLDKVLALHTTSTS